MKPKTNKRKESMDDESTLEVPTFSGRKQDWQPFAIRFQAFLALKRASDALDKDFVNQLPERENSEYD